MSRKVWMWAGIVVGVVVVSWLSLSAYYLNAENGLCNTEWGVLNAAYHDRAAIIPGLAGTVRSVALYDGRDYGSLKSAEAAVASYTYSGDELVTDDPSSFEQYVQTQRELTSAIYTIIGIGRDDPTLRYDAGFVDLQNVLAVNAARIERAKRRYDDAARIYNDSRKSFPDVVIAKLLGNDFRAKGMFAEHNGAKKAKPAT